MQNVALTLAFFYIGVVNLEIWKLRAPKKK